MLTKLALAILVLLALPIGWIAWIQVPAHIAIRRAVPPLPSLNAILSAASTAGQPTRLSYVNTARQPSPGDGLLSTLPFAGPRRPFVASYLAFVLEWADGRLLLVDVGMNREHMVEWGRGRERGGYDPIEPLETVAEALGTARERVGAIVFTHLHDDHVSGIQPLCDSNPKPIPVFMGAVQFEPPSHTTRGRAFVQAADCADERVLAGHGILPVPGFPGVFMIPVAGHTPGSQLIVAYVDTPGGRRGYVFVGDIVNNTEAIDDNIPKPLLYRIAMVPEDERRLGELRLLLRKLRDDHAMALLVSHDQSHLANSGLARWSMPGVSSSRQR